MQFVNVNNLNFQSARDAIIKNNESFDSISPSESAFRAYPDDDSSSRVYIIYDQGSFYYYDGGRFFRTSRNEGILNDLANAKEVDNGYWNPTDSIVSNAKGQED